MSDLFTFDAARGHHLFIADAYEGGEAWDRPSSSTLGVATLHGYRVGTVETRDAEGRVVGAEQVVAEAVTGTVRSYLVPWPGESESNFHRRRALAVYINLVEPIVDAYTDAIVPRISRQFGAAEQYLSNLDADGQRWSAFVGDVALQAALDGVTAAVIDLPVNNPAATRAEEAAMGIGLRAAVIPVASWAWMRVCDETGAVEEFAYADTSLLDDSAPIVSTQTVRVWVWRADDIEDNGAVTPGGWSVYEAQVPPGSTLGSMRAGLIGGTPCRSGPLHPSLKGRIPVVFAYHRRVRGRTRAPRGKSLAASPAAVSRQVYQLLSQVEDTQRRAPPFLSVPTKASNGLEPEAKAVAGPDRSLPAPESGGTPTWVTFPPAPLADIRTHVAFLVGLAFRVAGLEVQVDQSAQVQSGEALRVRSRGFESRASKFAANLQEFEARAFDIAAALLGLPRAEFAATYPQRFVLGDTTELLDAALSVLDKLSTRLGPAGITAAVRQALVSALTLDDAQVEAVMAEVEAKLNPTSTPTTQPQAPQVPPASTPEPARVTSAEVTQTPPSQEITT